MADIQKRGDPIDGSIHPHWVATGDRTRLDRRHGRRALRRYRRHGFMITVAGATFQTDKVFVGVLIFAITGMFATEVVDRAERKFDKWRPKVGSEQ